MKKIFIVLLSFAALFAIPADKTGTTEHDSKSKFANDHFILKLKKNKNILAASYSPDGNYEMIINDVCLSFNLEMTKTKRLFPSDLKNNSSPYNKYELETYYVIYVKENTDIKKACENIAKNDKCDFAEPDFIGEAAGVKGTSSIPNDEFFSRQWGLFNDGSVRTTMGKYGKRGADMNVVKGWEIETGSADIIVGILDSGVKTDHPDLNGKLWVNNQEVKNGRDDDGNGFVDDISGYNFAYDNPNIRDDGGHGTNICGTVGASTDNAIGYAGIDQNCRLMVCKNLDDENLESIHGGRIALLCSK
jgi:subtilisin family serine protease